MTTQRVLFLRTHNSAQGQMAEGLLRSTAADPFEVASAGTEKTRVHPLAVKAMGEAGADLSSTRRRRSMPLSRSTRIT